MHSLPRSHPQVPLNGGTQTHSVGLKTLVLERSDHRRPPLAGESDEIPPGDIEGRKRGRVEVGSRVALLAHLADLSGGTGTVTVWVGKGREGLSYYTSMLLLLCLNLTCYKGGRVFKGGDKVVALNDLRKRVL